MDFPALVLRHPLLFLKLLDLEQTLQKVSSSGRVVTIVLELLITRLNKGLVVLVPDNGVQLIAILGLLLVSCHELDYLLIKQFNLSAQG